MKKKYWILLGLLVIIWLSTYFFISFHMEETKKLYLNYRQPYQEPGVTASFFGKKLKIITKSTVNTNQEGIYHISYHATNPFGIRRTIKRKVIVRKDPSPIIILNGKKTMTIDVKSTYQEPGATATNLLGDNLTPDIKISGSVNPQKSGVYTVTYQVHDDLGYESATERTVYVKDLSGPTITLYGNETMTLIKGTKYEEPGFETIDNVDGNLTEATTITHKINPDKIGVYTVTYRVKDKAGNKSTAKRTVRVTDKELEYQKAYDKIDNQGQTWWTGNKSDQKRPIGTVENEKLAPYNAYALGPNKKVIYLTFDEGTNETYVDEIIDVLNKENVKGTFFLCRNYILSNPDTIKKMVAGGHSVGNHTYHHHTMNKYATKDGFKKFLFEIRSTEDAFHKVTGKQMDKVYREPRGEWSYRSLTIMKDLGYKSFFWSADYLDWNGPVSKDYALHQLEKDHHNGAIYLIHPVQKANYQALPDFIHKMKDLGYQFDLVKNIK